MEYKKIRPKKRIFKTNKVLYIFLLFLFIGIGYAALTTSLSINGTTNVATNSWNIHFANLHVQSGSVEGNAPTVSSNSISYAATLAQPGDFYEFSVDIKNDGTLPGKISIVNLTGNNTNYLNTSYAYSNGDAITIGDIINAGKSKRITVKAWIPSDIDTSLLPTVDTPITLTFNLQYIQSEQDLAPDATDQLIALAKNNSCMSKYTGQVTDKVGITEQATQVYFDKCADKNNIIFNNMCWKVIRTTETGGLKMIYNGEPDGGKCLNTREEHKGIVGSFGTSVNLNAEYRYGKTFTYDISSGEFILKDSYTSTWSDTTYQDLLGKYTCKNMVGTCTTLYGINAYNDSTYAYNNVYTIGNTNYAQIGTSSYNSFSTSLAMVGYMFNNIYVSKHEAVNGTNKFGSTFVYDTNTNQYSLSGTTQDITSLVGSDISYTHYTCWNDSGICNTISYVYNVNNSENRGYYVSINNGKNIDDVIEEMLYEENVNNYDSSIKGLVDVWYEQNLSNKTDMLEDAIYCNSRNIKNLAGWNPNGGSVSSSLLYKNDEYEYSLSCDNNTDQFAIRNNNAKLKYPVGLLETEEKNHLNYGELIKTGEGFFLMAPKTMINLSPSLHALNDAGGVYTINPSSNIGVRPVISLAPGNTIASGSGSETDPWVIQE